MYTLRVFSCAKVEESFYLYGVSFGNSFRILVVGFLRAVCSTIPSELLQRAIYAGTPHARARINHKSKMHFLLSTPIEG
jgi:hypothetical protein